MLIFAFFCFFFLLPFSEASQPEPATDILVFSPHPDDETLCCAGTISKAVQNHRKVKVVFLTNGDGYTETACAWLKKTADELTPEDYIALGEQRQHEASTATIRLGLSLQDIVFLSYPDTGLFSFWEARSQTNYLPETTKTTSSPYKNTYNRAKQGYTKENLLSDIKDILREYRPKSVYTPYPLDKHKDHKAATHFVNLALSELMAEGENKWVKSVRVSYYLVHDLSDIEQYTQQPSCSEEIVHFKNQKQEATAAYQSQLNIEKEKLRFKRFIQDNELFWDVPVDKETYLNSLEEEWGRIAGIMQKQGYNVNFAPVVDVADNIEDMSIYLVKRERLYSQDPDVVIELTSKVIKAMNKNGITPVLKHFPGLGRSPQNPHTWLPQIRVSEKELYEKDILPFQELIKTGEPFWIMTSHTIYPCWDDKPASLSYKIQTELLRKKLGFQGIIISDEFLNMQAIEGYALQQGIEKPYIGEIVVRAFKAGTDIVIVYPEPDKAEEIISGIIGAVKKAVKEGRISEKEIDKSVSRILKEKERIFNKHLSYLLKDMSLQEKIAQKIIIDIYEKNRGILNKYNLGGIEARDHNLIEQAQRDSKILLFIAGQHEGGNVHESHLNTRSAYLTGREFERTLGGEVRGPYSCIVKSNKELGNKLGQSFFDFSQLTKEEQEKIINILCDTVDEHIKFYLEIKQGYSQPLPNLDYFSPLTMTSDISIKPEIKPIEALPLAWLTRFLDRNTALCAYEVLKEAFEKWLNNLNRGFDREKFDSYIDKRLYELNLLKEEIRKTKGKGDEKVIRLLCLATHPDDEDGEGLIYFRKKFNCQTYILLATRGEGGENLINSCLYDELGFLRTEEIERAASILGVKRIYYLGKKDFGYCLDPEEAFQKWGRQDTLEKLVYFIRLIRPHVIITKHNKFDNRDHGQHRALAILAEEAFDLAGDPKAYPEMIKDGLLPWQPLKFYQRSRDKKNFPLEDIVINTHELIPSEDKTYQQIALEALSQHKSQLKVANLFTPDKIAYELVKASTPLEQEGVSGRAISEPSPRKGEVIPSGIPGIKIVNDLKIGLIEENSNIFFIALKTLGCDVEKIDTEFIAKGDLLKYDTIVLSKGMDNVLCAVKDGDKYLLEFVQKGGNLVIFLQELGREALFGLAPYPLEISFSPISDEDSPVVILLPEHPLFNFPNKISSQDFQGWKQDRGLFFPSQYPDKYTELIGCPDSKSELIKSGYLVTSYGKGSYILTTYSWYRQLREFQLGAYKNLADMLAYTYAKKIY